MVLEEFKKFALRGNVIDMAVGVIMGGAFGKIVQSLVSDVLMPPLGKILGGVNFTEFYWVFGDQQFANLAEAEKAGAAVLAYGRFIQSVVDFSIVALAIFLMVKGINHLQAQIRAREELQNVDSSSESAPAAENPIHRQEELLTEIRDLLAARKASDR